MVQRSVVQNEGSRTQLTARHTAEAELTAGCHSEEAGSARGPPTQQGEQRQRPRCLQGGREGEGRVGCGCECECEGECGSASVIGGSEWPLSMKAALPQQALSASSSTHGLRTEGSTRRPGDSSLARDGGSSGLSALARFWGWANQSRGRQEQLLRPMTAT